MRDRDPWRVLLRGTPYAGHPTVAGIDAAGVDPAAYFYAGRLIAQGVALDEVRRLTKITDAGLVYLAATTRRR